MVLIWKTFENNENKIKPAECIRNFSETTIVHFFSGHD